MRLIDADEIPYIEYINGSVSVEKVDIDKMPTIDPVKHGKWIKPEGSLWNMANCSECGEMCVLGETAKFCPFCGASMIGVITKKRGRR